MKKCEIITAADASVPQTSVWQQLGDISNLSIQVKFSSNTLNGTLTLECDNVEQATAAGQPAGVADPVTVTGSSQAIVSGASHVWNITAANYSQIRVKWVPSSGTGTLSAYEILKELGLNRN